MIESTYDKVYPKDAKQQDVYEFVAGTINSVLQGFNATIFAYG